MSSEQLKAEFAKHFSADGKIRIIRAPGRVNLIGEHTDYNDGFVFPMAIEPQVIFVCRARNDHKVVAKSSLFPDQPVEIDLGGKISKGMPKWGNYVRGPIAYLLEKGIPLVGMDVLIVNTLPMGGGLSSSAAMEVGTTRAMLALSGQQMDVSSVALLCQKAEHNYADVPCGIMDQTIVAGGKVGHAMLLDCRDNSKQFVPLNAKDLTVVVVNSMVKHELSGGEYAERRHQCEAGVKYFQKSEPKVKALRDVTMEQVLAAKNGLEEVVFMRCRHVVGEIKRCLDYAECLKTQKYEQAGKLMVESHRSLQHDYQVSTEELDYLVDTAIGIKGVYGSRMTGGGFGGCTVSLVIPRAVDAFIEQIKKAYLAKYKIDPVVFATSATDGAGVVE